MFSEFGRVPRFFVFIVVVTLFYPAIPVAAQQRLPLTIAEAGDLALRCAPSVAPFREQHRHGGRIAGCASRGRAAAAESASRP